MTPDERRGAIVEAVVPLILESGTMPTTREIARAAGVAEGTIFRVFDDKTALLWAVTKHVLSPPPGADAVRAISGEADLVDVLTTVVERIQGNMRRVGTIMMVLRQQMAGQTHDKMPDGPPAFLIEANQLLLDRLTLVFEKYADQLVVDPRTAALALRSLVFGAHHPGMAGDPPLGAAQIALLLVHGVGRPADLAPSTATKEPSC
ncbi:TetR/AcrR family transcriptional regulator [Nocardioides sp.]|uniref:TetR/AcrR family transcriptional regulator n=1 Tax=Nocardioides sp. TaxID=35761 RepID=UPI003527AABE